ncbi:holo-ACP synthase [Haloimpatiens sp. FM7330]|uniref:holo-ACP synthase n=1 Tax=Haloimpatiens sp. FM7330 TaxID=3298610 RepID=UPI00363627F9
MIWGVGIDIVEIKRIGSAVNKSKNFLEKILNEQEIQYLAKRNLRCEYIAGRFAAKEAVAKALGTGFRGFNFKDIIIENTNLGKPVVILKNKAKDIASKKGKYNIHLSISHSNDNAIAYAVWEVYDYENRNSSNE